MRTIDELSGACAGLILVLLCGAILIGCQRVPPHEGRLPLRIGRCANEADINYVVDDFRRRAMPRSYLDDFLVEILHGPGVTPERKAELSEAYSALMRERSDWASKYMWERWLLGVEGENWPASGVLARLRRERMPLQDDCK